MGLPSLIFQLCSPSNSKRHLGILPVEQLFLCDTGRRRGALWGPNRMLSDKMFLQILFYYSSTFPSSQVSLRHHNKHMYEFPFHILTHKQIHTHASNHMYTLHRVTRTRITANPTKQSNNYNSFSNKPYKSSPELYFSKHSVIFNLYLNWYHSVWHVIPSPLSNEIHHQQKIHSLKDHCEQFRRHNHVFINNITIDCRVLPFYLANLLKYVQICCK